MKKILLIIMFAGSIFAQNNLLTLMGGDDWIPTMDATLMLWTQDFATSDSLVDLSGKGYHLASANAPTLNLANLNGHNTITFNGSDESARRLFTKNTPFTVIMVVKSISWTNNDYFFDGGAANKGLCNQNQAVGATMYMKAEWTASGFTPNVGTNAGSIYQNWHIITCVYQGVGSYIKLDELAVATSPSGTFTSTTGASSGFTIAARGDLGGTNWANIEVAAVIITSAVDDLTLLRHRRYLNKIFQVY